MAINSSRIIAERDPKDSHRFDVTIPDAALVKTGPDRLSLDIADAEKLLKIVRTRRAKDGADAIYKGQVGAWLKSHAAGTVTLKEYSVSRKAAGSVPAHWRVGVSITFATPALAQAFATTFKIP